MADYPGIITGGRVQVPAHHDMLQGRLTGDPHGTLYVKNADLGTANSGALLGPDGKLLPGQLPAEAPPVVVADETERLALVVGVDIEVGNYARQLDVEKSFLLTASPASNPANWLELSSSGAVDSVDGLTGTIVLPSDAVAGTGSKRTLGTGAQQAAAGNHLHDTRYRRLGYGAGPPAWKNWGTSYTGLVYKVPTLFPTEGGTLAEFGAAGVATVGGMFPGRGYTHLLARTAGHGTPLRTYEVPGTTTNTQDIVHDLDIVREHGSIHSVYIKAQRTVTGPGAAGRRVLRLVSNGALGRRVIAELDFISGTNANAGEYTLVPLSTALNANLLYPGDRLEWESENATGAGLADTGDSVIQILWNGAIDCDTNHGVLGAIMVHDDREAGGWMTAEQYEMHKLIGWRSGNASVWATEPVLDAAGRHLKLPLTSGMTLANYAYNDMRHHADEVAVKLFWRYWFSLHRSFAGYGSSFTAMHTYNNGSGGGTFAWSNGAGGTPDIGYTGQYRKGVGTLGSTKPFEESVVADDYDGEPLALVFATEPSRTVTGTTNNGSNSLQVLSGLAEDDVGKSVDGPGIAAGTTVLSLVDSTLANLSAVSGVGAGTGSVTIGHGGFDGTITINGQDPATAGWTVNGDTSDQITTDQIITLTSDDGDWLGARSLVPVVFRLIPDDPSAVAGATVTVRVRIDTMGPDGVVYFLGLRRECPLGMKPQMAYDAPNTPSLEALGGAYPDRVLDFNTWQAEVAAELGFEDVVILPLHEALSPGNTPIPEKFFEDGVHPGFSGEADAVALAYAGLDTLADAALAST